MDANVMISPVSVLMMCSQNKGVTVRIRSNLIRSTSALKLTVIASQHIDVLENGQHEVGTGYVMTWQAEKMEITLKRFVSR